MNVYYLNKHRLKATNRSDAGEPSGENAVLLEMILDALLKQIGSHTSH